MTMFSKRLLSLTTVLMTLTLLTLTIPGCRKDLTEPMNETDQSLQFNGTGDCENGVKLLQMAYQNNALLPINRSVELLNNGAQEELQDLNDNSSVNLLEIYSPNGTVTWGGNFLGVGGAQGTSNWINGTEILRIKLGNSANIAGWKILCAGIWVNLQPGATIQVQTRKNNSYAQSPIVRTNNSASPLRLHLNLSYQYLFDEIEVTAIAGDVQLLNSITSGTAYNRFVITNHTNDIIASRYRLGIYFWNSLVSNSNVAADNQFLVGGDFIPTPNGDEWMLDAASPSFIRAKNKAFGPSASSTDYSVHRNESMTFQIGPDVGVGASFTNVVLPIYRPASNAAIPRIILKRSGMTVLDVNLQQQPGTLQYHLVGVNGGDFDEITFTTTTTAGSPLGSSYEVQTDYWSVLRFSLCQSGGGGMMLQSMRDGDFDELDELAPFDREE